MENELRYKNYQKRLKYWNIINNLTRMNKTGSTITKIKFVK